MSALAGYDLTCTKCSTVMTWWEASDYYRCKQCGFKITIALRPPLPPSRVPKPPPSVVYFLKVGDRVKIGHTTALPRRIESLSLEPTVCVLALIGGAAEEAQLHQRFAPYRIHKRREWFSWNDDVARFVENHRDDDVKRQAMRMFLP